MPIGLNEVVDRGVNVALSRRLGLQDTSVTLMPELAPVMQLPAEELMYHMGWRRYMVNGSVGAVVGQSGIVQFRMPKNSNLMALIESFTVGGPTQPLANQIAVSGFVGNTDLATVITGGQPRDTRQPFKPGTCILSETTQVGFTAGAFFYTTAQLSGALFPLIILSAPDSSRIDGYTFQLATQNLAFDWTIVYRERILNDQENVP